MKETERLTERRIELNEDEQQKISDRLTLLRSCLQESPKVEITYFIPDEKKAGGEYSTVNGIMKKLDEFQRLIIMMNGTKIPIEEIIDVGGAMFCSIEDLFA